MLHVRTNYLIAQYYLKPEGPWSSKPTRNLASKWKCHEIKENVKDYCTLFSNRITEIKEADTFSKKAKIATIKAPSTCAWQPFLTTAKVFGNIAQGLAGLIHPSFVLSKDRDDDSLILWGTERLLAQEEEVSASKEEKKKEIYNNDEFTDSFMNEKTDIESSNETTFSDLWGNPKKFGGRVEMEDTITVIWDDTQEIILRDYKGREKVDLFIDQKEGPEFSVDSKKIEKAEEIPSWRKKRLTTTAELVRLWETRSKKGENSDDETSPLLENRIVTFV